mgnify:CR=1 FL=1
MIKNVWHEKVGDESYYKCNYKCNGEIIKANPTNPERNRSRKFHSVDRIRMISTYLHNVLIIPDDNPRDLPARVSVDKHNLFY